MCVCKIGRPQSRGLLVYAARGMPTVLWSYDTLDWQRPGSWVVTDRIVRGSHPGGIVLAHDIHGPTVRAVPDALDRLLARGFQCVQAGELCGLPRWGGRQSDRLILASRS